MPPATSIQPWLIFEDAPAALAFYKAAFGARETYRMEPVPGELLARLSVGGAEFWVASGGEHNSEINQSVRFVVVVPSPEVYFEQALQAGATEVFAPRADHGWLSAKVADPFGHHWEFGHEVE
ncbi:MAG TPA: VOC family protein [Robiginitalea sp.]|nr:VOC family protein [Robiginitalea sp.]